MATLNKMIPLLRIFHWAAGFLIIRPILNFWCRLRRAIGQQPGADFGVIFWVSGRSATGKLQGNFRHPTTIKLGRL